MRLSAGLQAIWPPTSRTGPPGRNRWLSAGSKAPPGGRFNNGRLTGWRLATARFLSSLLSGQRLGAERNVPRRKGVEFELAVERLDVALEGEVRTSAHLQTSAGPRSSCVFDTAKPRSGSCPKVCRHLRARVRSVGLRATANATTAMTAGSPSTRMSAVVQPYFRPSSGSPRKRSAAPSRTASTNGTRTYSTLPDAAGCWLRQTRGKDHRVSRRVPTSSIDSFETRFPKMGSTRLDARSSSCSKTRSRS